MSPGSGNFEVMEGDSLAASGRIELLSASESERVPFFYDNLAAQEWTFDIADESNIVLKPEDLYKEFLLRGYEYGPQFQGIHSFSNTGDEGYIYWQNNWVTFLDALLQASIVREKSDKLRLPVKIDYLKIDPVRHLKSVQSIAGGGEQKEEHEVIGIRCDRKTEGMLAGGVEMRHLKVQTAQRRVNQPNLFLETVQFVPYFDSNVYDQSPQKRQQLIKYRTSLYQFIATKANHFAARFDNNQDLLNALNEIKSTNFKTSSQYVLTGNQISSGSSGEYSVLNAIIHSCAMEAKEDDGSEANKQDNDNDLTNSANLLKDIWWNSGLTQKTIKPAQDIVIENAPYHRIPVLMIEPANREMIKPITTMFTCHPQVEPNITIAYNRPLQEEEGDATLPDYVTDCKTLKIGSQDEDVPDEENRWYVALLDRVLHSKAATDGIHNYLISLKNYITHDGFLIVNEVTRDFPLAFVVDFLLSSFTSEDPLKLKMTRSFRTDEEWTKEFSDAGYNVVGKKSDDCIPITSYLLRRKPSFSSIPIPSTVKLDDVEEFSWVEMLQNELKKVEEERSENDELKNKSVWIESSSKPDNGLAGLTACFCEEDKKGNKIRNLFNIDTKVDGKTFESEVLTEEVRHERYQFDLVHNLYKDGQWGFIGGYFIKDHYEQLVVETENAFMTNTVHGDLTSFQWIQNPNDYWHRRPAIPDDEGLCEVYYSSLNFRDVMLATGRFIGGGEYGKRVMGMVAAQSLATTVSINRHMCFDIPDDWTLEEAATVPIVYNTAYYALVMRGGIKEGDKVLIHSGSGGVGQAAIAIALSYNCTVFTTVGSPEKKAFLRQRFPQLLDQNFSNSRTTEFEFDVLRETNGEGVDIVLNSLSEDKLIASVRCLARFGRFLEIGKFDLANNSKLGMEVFLKNIQFHGILLDGIASNEKWKIVGNLLRDGIRRGVVKPLPLTKFTSEQVEDAFRYMAQGKHIGKVVVEIRPDDGKEILRPVPIKVKATARTHCDPLGVYLITGGLGGFGLELANWLVKRGARKIVLTSRSGVRSGYQKRLVHHWRNLGVDIVVSKLNIGNEADCRQLINLCQQQSNNYRLDGIFHLAMVLRDSLFENQNAQNFKESAATKYWGTKYLDRLSRELCGKDLRWFVCFSSVSSGRGNKGQTNYGWANSTMERICEQRHANGFHGLAIQWGAIGDVGIILKNMGDNNTEVSGTLPQRIPSCIQTLDMFLSWDHPVVSAFVRADTKKADGAGGTKDLMTAIARILGATDSSQLDGDAQLGDLGLDSLMGMEIKQAIERNTSIVLSIKEIQTTTLNKLKAVASKLDGAKDSLKPVADSTKAAAVEGPSIESIKEELVKIFRLRIDVNNCVAQTSVVPINDLAEKVVQSQRCVSYEMDHPLFFVHTMEGVSHPLHNLGSKFSDEPAFCIQCTKDTPLDSIESMAKHYIKKIRQIQPEGPYRLVGYSYGACIAFEMAVTMQQTFGPESVASLTILDSSHQYMRAYSKLYRLVYQIGETESLVSNKNFESELLVGLAARFAAFDQDQFRVQLLNDCTNWDQRLTFATQRVAKSGLLDEETMMWVGESVRQRFIAADKYDPEVKFVGDLTLVRAKSGGGRYEQDFDLDYGLGKVVSGKVDVIQIDGTHEDISQDKAEETSKAILNPISTTNRLR